jgi:GR25 family glycosyltransferase involved in LPS biosynthesis
MIILPIVKMNSTELMKIDCLVINLDSDVDRKRVISERLRASGIQFEIVQAVTTETLTLPNPGNMNLMAVAVWQSHLKCLRESSESGLFTLILEDDAVIGFDNAFLIKTVNVMSKYQIDFLQVGYLRINGFEYFSILARNVYNFFVSKGLFSQLFSLVGLGEVKRVRNQKWLKDIPRNFVLNDIRYGAHCYIVAPTFSRKIQELNNPPFLAADDFYVSLGKMKSFKMFRLRKSLSKQGMYLSNFIKRYGIEEVE